MDITYFNGKFIPKDEVRISPEDRGFLFGDGIYEVVRWYEGFFYDMDGHLLRLKRSLGELQITWNEADSFPLIALNLINQNSLQGRPSMVYIQITRGAAKRTHFFPSPEISPTIYAYAWGFKPDTASKAAGIKVLLKEDIRWSRCDIKSVALLANTISFQEAWGMGLKECIFARNGVITEGSHSNIFFVRDNTLVTHPESNFILSGITRKNVIRIAGKAGIKVREEAVNREELGNVQEAFITNTSAEVTPVTEMGGILIGNGLPGPVTLKINEIFESELKQLKG